MKISLYTISLSGGYYAGHPVPLLDIFPLAQKWGYDGVELEAKRPHGNPMDLDASARREIRKAAQAHNLEIPCVASYNDFSSPIDEHRENEMLMVREQIRLAADLGAPYVRVFAAWSGVSRRNGAITYDLARYNIDYRFPGTTQVERWCYARECLGEMSRIAEREGVTLALQNHKPLTVNWYDVLNMVEEINSPALQVCLDAPLFDQHSEAAYREALVATGKRMVHSHYGGRFEKAEDGSIRPVLSGPRAGAQATDYPLFTKLAKEIAGFEGHTGYELCSPVLIGHNYAGLGYAKEQCELAAAYMRQVIESV
jgi:sugar phosphate isomerase/epimerase